MHSSMYSPTHSLIPSTAIHRVPGCQAPAAHWHEEFEAPALSRGAHSSMGRPSLSRGTREGLVPGLGPCIPGKLRVQECLATPRPECSICPPLQNTPGFTLTPPHLPLVQGGERGCGQCPFSPLPTARPLLGSREAGFTNSFLQEHGPSPRTCLNHGKMFPLLPGEKVEHFRLTLQPRSS